MQALLISLVLAVILGYLWYASLQKKCTCAFGALTVLNTKMQKRFALLNKIDRATGGGALSADQLTLISSLKALQTKSTWNELFDEQLPSTMATWLEADQLLKQLLLSLNNSIINSDIANEQLQFELDFVHARDFYSQAVSELNEGVKMFPGSIIAQIAKITALPEFVGVEN